MPSLLVLLAIAPVLLSIKSPGTVLGFQATAIAWWFVVGGTVLVTLVAGSLLIRWNRAINTGGDPKYARLADRGAQVAQHALLSIHLIGCLGLGWPEIVAQSIGESVNAARTLALVPFFAGLITLWWLVSGVQRRVLEMSLISRLDRGEPVETLPSRAALTWDRVRSQLVVTLGPVVIAYTLFRLCEGYPALQIVAFVGVVVVSPMLIVRLLPTVPLQPGRLRTSIELLARTQHVRVRSVRVWNTRGVMANAAVVGVVPPFRCVLLSDAVLNFMREQHVAAIILHECAHIRKRHPMWYVFALLSVSWVGAYLLDSCSSWMHRQQSLAWMTDTLPSWWTYVPYGMMIALSFGLVSRTFEREADALAVDAMTKTPFVNPEDSQDARPARHRAVSIMKATLLRTSQINGIPPDRRSFTHGSITKRGVWLNRLKSADIGTGRAYVNARLLRCAIVVLMVGAGLILLFDTHAWSELQRAFSAS